MRFKLHRRLVAPHIQEAALVTLASAVCLAVGMWMQHQNNMATMKSAVLREIWSTLEAETERLAARVSVPATLVGGCDGPVLGAVTDQIRGAHDPRHTVALLCGNRLHSLADSGDTKTNVTFRPTMDAASGRSAFAVPGVLYERGELLVDDGRLPAVGAFLPDSATRLVVYLRPGVAESLITALSAEIPGVAILTFVWILVVLAPATYLLVAGFRDRERRQQSQNLTDRLQRNIEVLRSRDAVIFGLAKLAESRDPETGEHLDRIAIYSTMLATEMRRHAPYCDQITPAFIHLIGISSALHDIGKVGIPDRILLKPDKLSAADRTVMEEHATLGGDCLLEIERRIGGSNFLSMAREIAYGHHEQWDGKGYPCGLRGAQIPISARIVALVDMYDALNFSRVYKTAISHAKCVTMIHEEAGKKLDPGIVEIWLTIAAKFEAVARRYAEATKDVTPIPDVVQQASMREVFAGAGVALNMTDRVGGR